MEADGAEEEEDQDLEAVKPLHHHHLIVNTVPNLGPLGWGPGVGMDWEDFGRV